MSCRALPKRDTWPNSAAMVTAEISAIPRSACRSLMTCCNAGEASLTASVIACSRRATRSRMCSTRQDYLHEAEHMRERVARLEQAITEAVKLASPALQQVINDLQALRGIADISAVTIAAELGQVSRFDSARQLMGYCGVVPSEDSSGRRTRRGGITKTGNAHLRRMVVEAAWNYRRPPGIWYGLRRRQESISEKAKEIAWKADEACQVSERLTV